MRPGAAMQSSELLGYKKRDPGMLEISSTMCHLAGTGMEKGEIPRRVEHKKPKFGAEQCERAGGNLEIHGAAGSRHG